MKKFILPFVFLALIFSACKTRDQKKVSTDVAFTTYVQAFTSGVVSSKSTISIYLTHSVERKDKLDGIFRFSPEIKGKTVLVGDRIFEFRPEEAMEPGTTYKAEFSLGKVLDVEDKLQVMPFQFSTVQQSFSVTVEGLKSYEGTQSSMMQLTGYVLTADVAEDEPIEKIVEANFEGVTMPLIWVHDSDGRKHFFTVDSIARKRDETAKISVEWNGDPLKVKNSGSEELEVPSLNSFKILDATVVQQPEQCIHIRFSDPLLKTQDLSGLIELDNASDTRFEMEGNLVKVWLSNRVSGELTLSVHEGIKSSNYARLKSGENFLLEFTNAEPRVRLIGKGVIVPQSETLLFPFEAISLNAVDVRVIQIFKDNIGQFFQENRIDGSGNLKQVGRLVYQGKVDLTSTQPVNYNTWNTFKIDLAKLFTIEQGAIYNVELRFKKDYSLYVCKNDSAEEALPDINLSEGEAYKTEWDGPGWYSSYYYPEGYNWRERDNPCHVSYYNSDRFVSRNIMASQLGIVAKEGKDHRLVFAVSNLLTTEPETGVDLQLYNFQNQLMETIKTDSRGFAEIDMKKKPFLLVAQKGNQFGYLRLDDGTSLSVSNFNVAGEEISDGMKGFIYGERDVWRPGDTLFLNFILETASLDNQNHPVIFSLLNPKNQQVERRVVTTNENGFYRLTTQTEKDAPTGNWLAEVQVGNSKFSKRIKIETIKPNRLKINLDLPSDKLLRKENTSLPIHAEWLHGSPAKSLKAKVEALFTKGRTEFDNFQSYTFADPATNYSQSEQTIFDGKLDEQGNGTIPLKLEGLDGAPGMLNVWFTSRVFESGGDFSTSITKARYSPYKSYVGVRMPESEDNWYTTDTEYLPEIVVVDEQGKPVNGDNLEARLYKINWRWWWESGSENLAHYVSGRYYQPVTSWKIEKAQAHSKIKLKVKYNNWQDNGRYFLWVKDNSSGHSTGTTFYMSEWGGWRSDGMDQGATLLSVRTDKEKYNVDDDIEVIIPSSKSGKALVSLENGTEVLDMFWVETNDKQTRFTVKANNKMAPNFYVNVSLIQPYGSTENDAPLRLYGITPVLVDDQETMLKPQIKTQDEIEPESNYTVEVSEANGKKMTYTLAIVDEGLLGLTNYKTPNPHHTFYRREALGVKTWDLYDYVAGAYGARLEKAFAVGGDGDMVDSEKKEANRFKPVVTFAGPFTLKAGEKQKHTFEMPNYVGAVRMMVVAGNQGAYGSEEISVPVRKGLMLLATVPRMLAPLESFELPVDVFAMKDNVKNVSISVKTNEFFEIVGSSGNKVQFDQPGEQMSFFKIKVKDRSGVGKIVVEAKSGSEKASYEVEVQVRNPNLAVTVQQSKLVEGNGSWQTELPYPGEIQSNEAWVEVSGFPPLNLSKHLDYLIQYPHGCVEQVTSSVFPQLFLSNLTEITADQKLRIETNIRKALIKLQSYQLGSGGFSYWPGSSYTNEWATSYVGHFLILAENAGYSLPYGLKDKWLRYQRSKAGEWKGNQYYSEYRRLRNDNLTQAYRLYTLALAGKPDMGAMNRLREKEGISADVSWRLASAYVLAGKKDAAKQLVNGVSTEVKEYNEFGGTFGSSLRDKAMLLESLTLLDEEVNASAMLQNISEELKNRDWLSTQTAAWCLVAASRFSEKYYGDEGETNFELTVNGEKHQIRTKIPVVTLPVEDLKSGKVSVSFENKGKDAAFAKVVAKGIPTGVDSTSASNNLLLSVKYLDSSGKSLDPEHIQQGTDFKMVVTVKHPGKRVDYEEMVLSSLIPSGWEILNKRLGDAPQDNSGFEYQDIRDDRIYTYFDLEMNKQKTFEFFLNAAYKGTFYQPPVTCEAMYDNTVSAKQGGKMVDVE